MDDERVPADLARLWRLSSESKLGRPAKLDIDRIVRTAVELADREGAAAATLPRVAEALGVTKMSLYRHVGSKDDLVVLMEDWASGPPPELPDAPWRPRLRAWARALLETNRRHPWLAFLPVRGAPRGPNGVGWFDSGLGALRETPLGWGAKVQIVGVVSGYTRSSVQLIQGMEDGRRGAGIDQAEAERDYARTLVGLVDPERFPEAAGLFASGLFETPPDDAAADMADVDFCYGLDIILDGVSVAVEAAGSAEE